MVDSVSELESDMSFIDGGFMFKLLLLVVVEQF